MEITFKKSWRIDEALTEDEQAFREAWRAGHPVRPTPEQYVKAGKMAENDYFDQSLDVSVVRHQRYLSMVAHAHEFIEMAVVFKGSCVNQVGERTIEMSAGDICLIAPGTMHNLEIFDDSTLVFNYLIRVSTFENAFFYQLSSGSILAEFFRQIFYGPEGDAFLLFRTGQDAELLYYLAGIYGETGRTGRDKNPVINTMLNMFFLILVRRHSQDVVLPREDPDAIHPVKLLSYMQDHYDSVTLAQMAEHFHYSERQMKRVLQKYTGRSFRENILRIRMNEASRLLEKTRLPVSDIADRVGYSDVSGFRQAFHKFYGKNPGAFRK